ncbi:putative Alpha-mannosidase 2 [Cocos nucifera]|nr:putative Alpha-mannosidase 2 [Cocos nucifera]
MVGISMGDGGQVSRASLKKTMEDLTKELEQASQKSTELNEDKDPLFVANVGDYSTITRMASS